jgi:hypothetical protein
MLWKLLGLLRLLRMGVDVVGCDDDVYDKKKL